MFRLPGWILVFSLGVLISTGPVRAQEAPRLPADLSDRFAREIRPLLSTHCVGCHNSKKASGKFNLETLQTPEAMVSPARWKKVWERVRSHQMPPPERPQPTFAERQRIVAWIEEVFVHATLHGQRDPGPLPTRRLNVREMMNTLRDLAVTNGRPAARKTSFEPLKDGRISLYRMIPPPDHPCDFVARILPQDTNDGGFDTIADNLSLPPFLMEKYLRTTKLLLDDVYSTKGREASGRYNWPFREELDRLEKGPPKGLTQRQGLVKLLQSFATRAFRRPVSAEEVEKYAKLFDLAQKKGENFETAIRLPLQAILVSPSFVLLWAGEEEKASAPVRPLNEYELATRLSYFIWSSMPDRELFQLAEKGQLRDEKVLDAQIRRMMADWRARDGLLHGFLMQWLQVDRLERANPDAEKYASYFQNNLSELMTQEVMLFADAIMVEDRSILEFIDADWGFISYPLAQHYGLENFPGKKQPPGTLYNWYRVKYPDKRRGGVLTMGKVLTGTSQSLRTSPVARGKWVLETILGTPPAPPPPDVDNVLREDKQDTKNLTVRQRMEKHRADKNCASCHRLIDPLGMALEKFDPVGRWREKDHDQPIDSSGELVDGTNFKGIEDLKAGLIANKDEFTRAFVQHMLAYGLGRKLDYYDAKTVREITAQVARDDYKISRVVTEIAKSYPFRNRRVKEGGS
jgi:mono/diheme cytochrome c family protein